MYLACAYKLVSLSGHNFLTPDLHFTLFPVRDIIAEPASQVHWIISSTIIIRSVHFKMWFPQAWRALEISQVLPRNLPEVNSARKVLRLLRPKSFKRESVRDIIASPASQVHWIISVMMVFILSVRFLLKRSLICLPRALNPIRLSPETSLKSPAHTKLCESVVTKKFQERIH